MANNSNKKLVPEAKITYIHGRMTKDQIEKTMESFVDKTYNVLVCTTIIETGIDIENANTLIVLDADHFGLSQLYQIRGRIGRGKVIAYAYLMYQKNKELNDIAVKFSIKYVPGDYRSEQGDLVYVPSISSKEIIKQYEEQQEQKKNEERQKRIEKELEQKNTEEGR